MTDTTQRTTTRSRDRTRARLLDAAAEVFAEVGVDAASVEAICERAGFTRGAFYSNFDSKDELMLALTEQVSGQKVDEVARRVSELQASGGDFAPAEIVERIMDVAIDRRMSIVLASEIRTRAMRDPALGRMYVAWQDGLVERIAGFVGELLASYGLKARLPEAELARVVVQTWEDSAVYAALVGLDSDAAAALVSARTSALATALVDRA